ncbi:MAG: HlyC/CorC family transporter [Microthrixaceae bacterium]|nr:HlyC/CorC family transporter [Microthrixaceae bacterium]
MLTTVLGLLAVLLLILATAFFVAAEFALVAVDRSRVEHLAADGSRRAKVTLSVLRRLSFHLSGAQLGITIVSLVLGFVAEPTVAALIEPVLEPLVGTSSRGVSVAIALGLATVFQMVVGELIPKNVVIARPTTSALRLAAPFRLYAVVFGPVISLSERAANWAVRRLGVEPQEELTAVRSLPELELLFLSSAAEGALEPRAADLLTRSIRFGEKTADDALTPRTALEALESDASLAELVQRSLDTGFSRFLVYGADLDDVRGVVHVKSVYETAPEDRATTPVSDVMSEAFVVPESRALTSLLVELRGAGSHLAVVVDEYGGTAGIVTLEDLIEEIVGEIDDEWDPEEPERSVVQPSGTYLLSGGLHPDEVRDACGFEVPDGEYETLAGFVLDRLGHLPVPGEWVTHDGWELEVVELDRRRIDRVRLVPPAPVPGTGASG